MLGHRPLAAPSVPSALAVTLAVALICIGCGSSTPSAGAPSGPVDGLPPVIVGPDGQPARTVELELPRFDAPDSRVRLSDLRGQVTLVTYFTTWCLPCVDVLPRLQKLADEVEGLAVVAVSLDTQPGQLVPPFVEYLDLSYPVLLGDEAHLAGVSPFGAIKGVPEAHLVDPAGRHVETFYGITPIEYLRRRVPALNRGRR